MALFSGSRMPNKMLAFVAPFLALLWTDAIIGFHGTLFYVYAAVALITLIGGLLVKAEKPSRIFAGSLLGSLVFFVITNFGVWFSQGLYPQTGSGLVQCFVAALPFFGNQIVGDLFYAGVLFGVFAVLKSFSPSLKREIVPQ
jgi:hypothetical protein